MTAIAHVNATPNLTVTTAPTAGWDALSAAMTTQVPVIAERTDLLVTIAPGAGHGHPACFLPPLASIEVDGTHLGGVDPGTAQPHLISDRARYATAWGLLTHECAHARHTHWDSDPTTNAATDAAAHAAATLLEEPRIEAAHLRRRPDDRHWLRASATNLILNDMKVNDPVNGPAMTATDAATAAALLLARVDAGVLTRAEVAPVARVVRKVLGTNTLARLRRVWRKALTTPDDDTAAMMKFGRRWADIVGPPDPAPNAAPTQQGTNGTPSQTAPTPPNQTGSGALAPSGSGSSSPLAEAITKSTATIARAVAKAKAPTDPADAKAAANAAADAAKKATRKANVDAAQQVFGGGTSPAAPTGHRAPTAEERTAARVLARALSTAGTRDRVATRSTSQLPPGRLRMRGVLTREAQLAAGRIPIAEPFTRTTRTPVPTPPLRLGIACDVSGSMDAFARPVSSAAWITANAARLTTVPATTATVSYNHDVHPITHPGTAPARVTEFQAGGGGHQLGTALDALDGALDLSTPNAARLVVIVSDGKYSAEQRRDAQTRLNRLRESGCAVLWLTVNDTDTPLDGATVHRLDQPTHTARAIGHAATTALRVMTNR
jgi:VWA domain-containing protein